MIHNFINGIHTGINTALPVNFSGLPEDEQPLTDDFNVCLTNDQQDCYTVLVSLAVRMERYRPYYWANKNFEKAKQVGLDSWYYMGLSIKTGSWNTLLTSFGLPTLYETSLCVLKRTFGKGLPHWDYFHLRPNTDFW